MAIRLGLKNYILKTHNYLKNQLIRKEKASQIGMLKSLDSGAGGGRTLVQTGKPYAFYMLIPAFDFRASTRPGPPIDALSSKTSSTHRGMSRLFPIVLHRLTNLIRNNIQLSDVSSCHLVTG